MTIDTNLRKKFRPDWTVLGSTRKTPFVKDFGWVWRILEGWSGWQGFLSSVGMPPDLLSTYRALKAPLSPPKQPIENCPLSSQISCFSQPATDLLVDQWGTTKLVRHAQPWTWPGASFPTAVEVSCAPWSVSPPLYLSLGYSRATTTLKMTDVGAENSNHIAFWESTSHFTTACVLSCNELLNGSKSWE